MSFVKDRPADDKSFRDFRFLSKSKYKRNENNVKSTSSKSESSTDKLKCPAIGTFEANIISVSFKSLWKEFQDNTTMHGIKNARKENKYQLRWVICTIALIGMGIILGYTVPKLLAYYMTNPKLTNINVKFVKEMLYPAVTICNMSPYKRSAINASAVMMSHLLHRSRLGDVFPPIDYTNPVYSELNDSVSEDWLDKVSFGLNDMFAFCENDGHLVSCETILTPKITQWGKCFTFNGNEKLRMEGRVKSSTTGSPTALTFYMDIKQHEYVFNTNTAAGIKIVLHDPEEEPDIINTGFVSSPGMSTYVSVKMTKYEYLPEPYKAGGDQYCTDTKSSDFVNTLKYYPFYSRTACLLECKRDFIVNKCGCRALTDAEANSCQKKTSFLI